MAKLLENLLLVQEKLLEQNPDTASVLIPGAEAKQSSAHGSSDDDEEIPSDTEDEKSDDDDVGENSEDENMDEGAENSLKLPAKRKHEMVSFSLCADIPGFLGSMSLFLVKQRTKTSHAGWMRFYVALTTYSKTSLIQTAKGPCLMFELQNCPSVIERCLYCGIVLKKGCDWYV